MDFPVVEERAELEYHKAQRKEKRAVVAVGMKASAGIGGASYARIMKEGRRRRWDVSRESQRRCKYLKGSRIVEGQGEFATATGRFSRI